MNDFIAIFLGNSSLQIQKEIKLRLLIKINLKKSISITRKINIRLKNKSNKLTR